jgi:GAF domain-containing protein
MTVAPADPVRDPQRLAALQRLALLDTPAEAAFDRLTGLATRVLRAPVALVALVDADRQFFKSCVGLPEPWATRRQTPLSHSFCRHEVAACAPLVIEDARAHPLVRDNPAIVDLGVVAYLGIPLIIGGGHAVGSFCVIDRRPRVWTAEEVAILEDLTAAVLTEIELRAANARLAELDRLRGESLAAISHDLRTPLTAARTALRLVALSAGDRLRPDERELLDNGRRNTERLGRLIDDLLALNQLTAGTLRLAREPLDLREIAADAAAAVEPLVRDKG